jgi:hypothetical protein
MTDIAPASGAAQHVTDDPAPTPFDLRQAEMEDLRDQGPGPLALWTATTIHAEDYL